MKRDIRVMNIQVLRLCMRIFRVIRVDNKVFLYMSMNVIMWLIGGN